MIRKNQARRPPVHKAAFVHTLEDALRQSLGSPRNSDLARPTIRLLSVNDSGNRFEIELRFESSKTYCCAEPGCHLATYQSNWWRLIRQPLEETADRNLSPMTLKIWGVVEDGARLLSSAALGLPTLTREYSYRTGPIREIEQSTIRYQ